MSLQADTPGFQQGSWNWRRHVSEILNENPNFRVVCLQFSSLSDQICLFLLFVYCMHVQMIGDVIRVVIKNMFLCLCG